MYGENKLLFEEMNDDDVLYWNTTTDLYINTLFGTNIFGSYFELFDNAG